MTGGNTDLGLECGRTQLLVITFYHKYFFAVLEVHLEVCMLTSTREAIDAAMTYRREKLSLATLKPKQEKAISNFPLGKDKLTGSQCFLNHCEESDNPSSQGISGANKARM